jgi:hypothetical protein
MITISTLYLEEVIEFKHESSMFKRLPKVGITTKTSALIG